MDHLMTLSQRQEAEPMAYTCGWCLKVGAEYKIPLNTDGSCSGYRYFCNSAHSSNWMNNVPRNVPIGVPIEAASIWEIIKQANLDSWFLVGLSQYGRKEKIEYRATFQHRRLNGATEEVFACFDDAPDPRLAVLGAYKSAMSHQKRINALFHPPLKPGQLKANPYTGEIPAKWSARIDAALDKNWAARKAYGARSRD